MLVMIIIAIAINVFFALYFIRQGLSNKLEIKQKILEVGERFMSTKTNKKGHGYGLRIIRRIVEKYQGSMEISYTEEYFRNKVTLKIKG